MSPDALKNHLLEYDGRAISMLSELAVKFNKDSQFLDEIISLSDDGDGNVSDGATWIIKNHLDERGALTQNQTDGLIGKADNLKDWVSQLHLFQSVSKLVISKENATKLTPWLTALLSHERPFLRAWSLDALCHLGQTFSQYKNDANAALERAKSDTAASVRTRARNIVKRYHA